MYLSNILTVAITITTYTTTTTNAAVAVAVAAIVVTLKVRVWRREGSEWSSLPLNRPLHQGVGGHP